MTWVETFNCLSCGEVLRCDFDEGAREWVSEVEIPCVCGFVGLYRRAPVLRTTNMVVPVVSQQAQISPDQWKALREIAEENSRLVRNALVFSDPVAIMDGAINSIRLQFGLPRIEVDPLPTRVLAELSELRLEGEVREMSFATATSPSRVAQLASTLGLKPEATLMELEMAMAAVYAEERPQQLMDELSSVEARAKALDLG